MELFRDKESGEIIAKDVWYSFNARRHMEYLWNAWLTIKTKNGRDHDDRFADKDEMSIVAAVLSYPYRVRICLVSDPAGYNKTLYDLNTIDKKHSSLLLDVAAELVPTEYRIKNIVEASDPIVTTTPLGYTEEKIQMVLTRISELMRGDGVQEVLVTQRRAVLKLLLENQLRYVRVDRCVKTSYPLFNPPPIATTLTNPPPIVTTLTYTLIKRSKYFEVQSKGKGNKGAVQYTSTDPTPFRETGSFFYVSSAICDVLGVDPAVLMRDRGLELMVGKVYFCE